MKKILISIIATIAIVSNLNAQSLGLGFSGQSIIGPKSLSTKFHTSYERSLFLVSAGEGFKRELFFAVETALCYGYQQTDPEKSFRYENWEELFYEHSFKHVLGVDVYGKVNIRGFQVLGGVGYFYAWPSKMESLQPEDGSVATVSTYGRMATGFKASAGLGCTLFSDVRTGDRLDIKGLCNFVPFNNSGQIVRKVGIEVGVAYYFGLK